MKGSRVPSACPPPPAHHDRLWRGLRTNDLSIVPTDHCPFCLKEQNGLGMGDFSKVPPGLPAVERRMDQIYQGVVRGERPLERWVEVTSTAPARTFGLFPCEGVLAPGSDAGIVIYDPNASQTISVATHHMSADNSAYEGVTLKGRAATVLSRGRVVVGEDRYVGQAGNGRFLSFPGTQLLPATRCAAARVPAVWAKRQLCPGPVPVLVSRRPAP